MNSSEVLRELSRQSCSVFGPLMSFLLKLHDVLADLPVSEQELLVDGLDGGGATGFLAGADAG